MNMRLLKICAAVVGVIVVALLWVWYHPISAVQHSWPGLAMEDLDTNDRLDARVKANVAPAPLPPAAADGPLAVDAYKNVQVLGHLTAGQLTRQMTAIATWVAPQQGCAYCHAAQKDAEGKDVLDEDGFVVADPERMDSDEKYTKQVARQMLKMTMHINQDWQNHIKQTGVTCYTCHRGNPVPPYLWFQSPENVATPKFMGDFAQQNIASAAVGYTALPNDPFTPFLANTEAIRVISTEALPGTNRASIKQAEWTYGLMMNISGALGVNCTHCHNTRAMADWSLSPPFRAQAWHGIQMSRDLNHNYLEPIAALLPANRLGPTGDGPKLFCATCHQGAYKPLLGAQMLKDYPALAMAMPQPQKTPPPEPEPAPPPAKPAAKPARK